ncbi:hypothetical protein [Paenibacillus chitinolyticus]|uniref:hypothetical protein n=1 Tax=Paenibacillus chitinolyticus TaxID=79263 RepID=UPI00295F513C|nr:hypothetical protein [Paenibacillus chitinolyticus]
MKIELIPNTEQHKQLEETIKRFNEVCNYISKIAFKSGAMKNKIKLQKESYRLVRDHFEIPSQLVVIAISKVVEAYKKGMYQSPVTFDENESVLFDNRLLKFTWLHMASITTIQGRTEIPLLVHAYRKGINDKRIVGHADLIKEENKFFILLPIDLPNVDTISALHFSNTKFLNEGETC